MKLYEKSQAVKIFLKKDLSIFSYCPWKRSKSFWIFVSIFFQLNNDSNFWKLTSIVFPHYFYKCFQRVCKNDDKTRCWLIFKNWSYYSIKKNWNKDSENFCPFSIDNKKIIDRACFKKFLITFDFLLQFTQKISWIFCYWKSFRRITTLVTFFLIPIV